MFASTSDSRSGWGTNEYLKGAFAQTSCFQQYSYGDKWHRVFKTLPKVKCKSRSFLHAWPMRVKASLTNQRTHQHTCSLTRFSVSHLRRRTVAAITTDAKKKRGCDLLTVNYYQMLMPPVHLVETHWKPQEMLAILKLNLTNFRFLLN